MLIKNNFINHDIWCVYCDIDNDYFDIDVNGVTVVMMVDYNDCDSDDDGCDSDDDGCDRDDDGCDSDNDGCDSDNGCERVYDGCDSNIDIKRVV